MEEFTIREAATADKEEVLKIREDDTDYLPEYYDHFMASPHFTSFVLIHQTKIIGFNAAFIIDDGETVVSRSARIHPRYEGRGLYRELDSHIINWAKRKQVRVKAITTSDENKHVSRPSFQSVCSQIVTMTILTYMADQEQLNVNISNTDHSRELTLVTETLMGSYINSKDICGYLFPQGRVVVDGVPFKLLPGNVPLMFEQNDIIVMFSDLAYDSKTCNGLLSIGTTQKIKNPSYIYNIELYGNATDLSCLKCHIDKHLTILKERAFGTVCIFVFVANEYLEGRVDEVFHGYGISRKLWSDSVSGDITLTKRLIYERIL